MTRARALDFVQVNNAMVGIEEPSIGNATYSEGDVLFLSFRSSEQITVGSWCSIGANVRIFHPGGGHLDGAHRLDWATVSPLNRHLPEELIPGGEDSSEPLVIGNDVWIGYESVVVGSVTIGDGAVIAPGSVVMKDVKPYAVVKGNPAKVVRYRFAPEIIERLCALKWWDWPTEKVVANAHTFALPVEEFLSRFEEAGT